MVQWQIRQILKFKDIFFGRENYSGNRSEKLLKQLKKLTEHIKQTRQSKTSIIEEKQYEQAANIREIEIADIERIIELLLIEAK